MDPYSPPHLVALAVLLLGLPVLVVLARRDAARGSRRLARTMAVAIPVVHVPTQVVDVLTRFDVDVSLPLHLCDLAWVAATWALWTGHRLAVALTYFWGLVLTTQAVVTPSLGEDFPDLRFFAFWALHLLIIWAAVVLVWGYRVVPDWREYRLTLVVTGVWAVATFGINEVLGTNYGYLQEKPAGGSVLDLLGPWPVYVLAEIAIVAAVWAAMTAAWPATRRAPAPRPDAAPVPS